jgi:hypothetical protein
MNTELRYSSTGVSIHELNAELDQIWSELQTHGSLLQRQAGDVLRKQGFNLTESLEFIKKTNRTDALTLRREAAGIGPAETAIIVSFAPLAAKIATALWDLMIARIKKKQGEDSLAKKES